MGGQNSKPDSLEEHESFQPTQSYSERLPNVINGIENVMIVCLEISSHENQIVQQWKQDLHQIIYAVETFTDINQCQAFISSIKYERILLIMSDSLDDQFARNMIDYEQVSCIFITCFHENKHKNWISHFRGIRGLYSTVDELLQQLTECRENIDHELFGFALLGEQESTKTKDGDQQGVQFMFADIFKELVLSIDENELEEMIQYISKVYRNNSMEKTFLNELRTSYHKKSPIYWYTRESCLNRMLNKALRLQQYETLFNLRVFIRHLLQAFQSQFDKTRNVNMILYRGFAMNKTDFNRIRLHEGRLMMISNFLSTTSNQNVAVKWANKSLYHRTKTRVLMIIDVKKYTDVPLVNIKSFDASKNEEDWLFSIGSRFRIGSANRRKDGICEINMTLTDDYDEQLMSWKQYFEKSLNKQMPYFSLGKLMFQLDEWSLAEKFYLLHLKLEKSLQTRATVLNNLGLIKTELIQYEEAIRYFEQSAKLEENEKNLNVQDRALHYNNMANVYYRQKKIPQAMEYFQKALDLLDSKSEKSQEMQATLYNNIATLLNDMGKYTDALDYNKKCLEIRTQIYPPMHPILANSYNSIASTLYHLNSYSEALDNANKAMSIDMKTLPLNHPQTSVHSRNLEVVMKNKRSND